MGPGGIRLTISLLPYPIMAVCFCVKAFNSLSMCKARDKEKESTEKKLEITKPNFQLVQTGPGSVISTPNHRLERRLCSLTQPTSATPALPHRNMVPITSKFQTLPRFQRLADGSGQSL